VDHGTVLALRFESMRKGRFQQPHYIFLNRPWKPRSEALRIHRHTIPEWISLEAVAAKYLPAPKLRDAAEADEGAEPSKAGQKQDLTAFARHIRRELTRRQLREGAISDLRDAAGLRRSRRSTLPGAGEEEGALSEITIVDAEAKQVKLEWADGRTGRLIVGDDVEVEKLVVFQGDERVRDAEWEFEHRMTVDQVTKWIAAD
jgi:central kinetochore subunit Mal2/MCM21